MFVSVIIPVYNDCERLKACLAALRRQSYPRHSYEIIVIDNGCNAGIREATDAVGCRLLVSRRNFGDASRNLGVEIAGGDVLAFTDSDCIPAPDWLEKGVTRIGALQNCGLVAGKVDWRFRREAHPTALEWYDSAMYLQQKKNIEQVGFGATANLFTTKAVFSRVGMFDVSLRCSSDFEWGRRVLHHGYAQVYAEDVVVCHAARTSLLQLCRRTVAQNRAFYSLSRRKDEWLASYIRQFRGGSVRMRMESACGEIRAAMAARSKSLMHKIGFIIIFFIEKGLVMLLLGRIFLKGHASRQMARQAME